VKNGLRGGGLRGERRRAHKSRPSQESRTKMSHGLSPLSVEDSEKFESTDAPFQERLPIRRVKLS
jgi:hypothetical protein